MQNTYHKDLIKDLLEGKLPWETLKSIMSSPKDEDRFEKVLEIEQEKVSWTEKIIFPIAEHLYIVKKGEEKLIKCSCGFEYGSYLKNWKESALVYERNPQDGEVFVGPRACDPEWMVLREFYCPGCGTQLEVESVPPGYPFIFDFLPDLDGLELQRKQVMRGSE